MQSGFQRFGHVGGLEVFDRIDPSEIAQMAQSKAIANLYSYKPPEGKYPMIAGGDL